MASGFWARGLTLLLAFHVGRPLFSGSVSPLWQDQTAEFLNRCVPAEGFPPEIRGSLYFAGPSLWSLAGQEASHSFDGLGRLHRLYYDAARRSLCHSARFIASPGNKGLLERCDLSPAGTFSPVKGAAWWRTLPMVGLVTGNMDNTWVNQLHFAGPRRLELMTDTSEVVVADAVTLEVTGKVSWNDSVVQTWLPVPPLSTAHPIIHPDTGEAYNILLDAGLLRNEVVLVKRSPAAPERREEVARVSVGSSMVIQHSWALSRDFALLFVHPMFLSKARILTEGALVGALRELPQWQNYTRLLLVPLDADGTAAPVREFHVAPFVLVHAVNAFQEGGRLVVDLEGRPVTAESESFYGAFHLDLVRGTEGLDAYFQEHFRDRGYGLYRLELPLGGAGPGALLEPRRLLPEPLIFPVVSQSTRGRRHCFVWAAEAANTYEEETAFVKLSLCDAAAPRRWRLRGYRMVAEPSLVPSGASSPPEDAGWLLAPLQGVDAKGGALAVVDAATMETVSLTPLAEGDALNWCAHSTFVPGDLGAAPPEGEGPPAEEPLGFVREAVRRCAEGRRGRDL